MGLLGGALRAVKGAANIATAPLRTAAKVVGTGLATSGNVLTNVAEGDLGGAVNAAKTGVGQQVGNVADYFQDNVNGVKDVVGGHGDFLKGGVGLIGTPIQGAARIAGNGLATSGNVLTNVAEGDLSGAGQAYSQGFSNQFSIAGDTFKQQVGNLL